jgi:hypothetical protein
MCLSQGKFIAPILYDHFKLEMLQVCIRIFLMSMKYALDFINKIIILLVEMKSVGIFSGVNFIGAFQF